MSGIPAGGSPQLYFNSVADADGNVRGFLFLHPSVPDAPIKTFRINLTTGQVLVGATPQGTGTIYDASGSAMLSYGSAPAINAPSGNTFTRVHDVCQFGDYEHGYAVALTQGPMGSDLNAPSHIVRYCDPADDIEVAANWSQVNIGAANRARSWDNGGTNGRRYNSDIRFLPPVSGEGFRCVLIAYDGSALYRTEVWGGASPDTVTLIGATPWVASPRPMRIQVNPGGANDAFLGTVSNFNSYTAFTNFVPGNGQLLNFTPTVPSELTAPAFEPGAPQVGVAKALTAATFSGYPVPTVTYQWRIADDGAGTGAVDIAAATGATYTPVAGDVGKFLRRVDTATNVSGSATASSNWSAATLAAGASFAWADIGNFVELAPSTATVVSGAVSSLFSTTADGGTATTFDNVNAVERPQYIAGPPARMDCDGSNDYLSGGTAARNFLRNRSAYMLIFRAEIDALAGANQLMVHCSSGANAGQQRLGVRMGSTNALQSIARRLDGDGASVVTGPTPTIGAKFLMASVVNFGTPSTHRFWVDGTEYSGTQPTSGTTSSDVASLVAELGNANLGSPFNGKIGAVVLLAKSSGSITPAQVAAALAKYDADYPTWA